MSISEIKIVRDQAWTSMLVAGEQFKANPCPFTRERHEAAWFTWERLDRAIIAAEAV